MTISLKRFERPHRRRVAIAGLLLAGVLAPAVVVGAADEDLEALAERLIELRGDVETIHDELEAKQQEHRNKMSSLAQRKAELEAQIQRQALELEKLDRSIAEVKEEAEEVDSETEALVPVAKAAIEQLERHVAAGLPFSVDERLADLEDLKRKMDKGELSTPRALNRAWTFVEDELRLAKENGLFRQTITLGGEEQLADVVRLGMTMLFFHTGAGVYGYAERQGDDWTYTPVEGRGRERLEALFEDFDKQVRTGFYEIPNALPGADR